LLPLISAVALALVPTGCNRGGDDSSETLPSDSASTGSVSESPSGDASASAGGGQAAEVVVNDDGFTQEGKTINYGVVLANRSSLDAVDVTIEVSFRGRHRVVLGSDRDTISVIPDGDWYYFGGQVSLTDARDVRRMSVALTTERSVDASYRLAPVSLVRIVDGRGGVLEVRGRVRNVGERGLPSSARIGVVLFDQAGGVVSGTATSLGRDVTRRSVAGFTASFATTPDNAAFAEATVDDVAARP
jgi:hypothetical protein